MKKSQQNRDLLHWERQLWNQGFRCVCGLDEAGRGAWAGPVFAAAVILKPTSTLVVDDSKKLSPEQREVLYPLICEEALAYAIAWSSQEEIDQINILRASLSAMVKAIKGLDQVPDFLLIDGNMGLDINIPQKALVKGDSLSASIASASILAKVARDRTMVDLGRQYPTYNFARHKGYGTALHQEELKRHGPLPCHRMTFAPLKALSLP